MKINKYCFLIFYVFITFNFKAQITVTNQSANFLVDSVLLGVGATVSNISFTGASQAIGAFTNLSPDFQFNEGILLTNGLASNAIGPNNNPSISETNLLGGDTDIDSISGVETFDASIIEFDFVPSSDTISFRYIFASEEYMEFVNSGVNDGFGFFISGPGITGSFSNNSENLALVPGTNQFVTIDNLNENNNQAFYRNNELPPGSTVQYDGITLPLVAKKSVQCGQTYHLKIVIADAGDESMDSGVFIEAGSFVSPATVIVNLSTENNDSILIEGCVNGSLNIIRPLSSINSTLTFEIQVTGNALNGVDYDSINSSYSFIMGEDSISIPINTILDNLSESLEQLNIQIEYFDNCGQLVVVSKTLWIKDPIKIDSIVSLPNRMCDGQMLNDFGNGSLELFVSPNSGNNIQNKLTSLNQSYTQTFLSNQIDSLNPGFYELTVSDGLCTDKDTIEIVNILDSKPIALFQNNVKQCYLEKIILNNESSSDSDSSRWYLNSIFYSNQFEPLFNGLQEGCNSVSLVVKNEFGCTDSLNFSCAIEIYQKPTAKITSPSFEYMIGTQDFILNNTSLGSETCIWKLFDSIIHIGCDDFILQPIQNAGNFTYQLLVSNEFGCIDSAFVIITVKDGLIYYVPNAFTPNGDELNNTFKPIFTSGFRVETFHLKIYNKWGESIFESFDPNVGWDGTYNNQLVKSDIYTWIIDFRDIQNNEVHQVNGFVTFLN